MGSPWDSSHPAVFYPYCYLSWYLGLERGSRGPKDPKDMCVKCGNGPFCWEAGVKGRVLGVEGRGNCLPTPSATLVSQHRHRGRCGLVDLVTDCLAICC